MSMYVTRITVLSDFDTNVPKRERMRRANSKACASRNLSNYSPARR